MSIELHLVVRLESDGFANILNSCGWIPFYNLFLTERLILRNVSHDNGREHLR
jgi:hypothetical protein